MVASPERMKEVDFSEAYYSGGQVLLVRKGEEGNFKSVEDLKGKKIGTQMASIQQQYAEANFDATVTGLENNNNLLMELKNNTYDCLFMAELAAKQFAYANDDVALIEDLGVPDEEGNAVAVKKGNPELLEVINEVISDLQKDDKVTSWFNQYVEISTKEINENMGSKIVNGLYIVGEILNIDGDCGGYNLQWAWSSAYVAASSI